MTHSRNTRRHLHCLHCTNTTHPQDSMICFLLSFCIPHIEWACKTIIHARLQYYIFYQHRMLCLLWYLFMNNVLMHHQLRHEPNITGCTSHHCRPAAKMFSFLVLERQWSSVLGRSRVGANHRLSEHRHNLVHTTTTKHSSSKQHQHITHIIDATPDNASSSTFVPCHAG